MSQAKDIEEPWGSALEATLQSNSSLKAAQCWSVACSGGLDSVVLLHVLKRLADSLGKTLIVLHFNHQLRGADSDADAQWVVSLCQRWKVPCVQESGDVRVITQAQGLSLEMAARECRHAFLARSALAHGAACVALAHHADDQLETLWWRWMRGSGPEGLQGMTHTSLSPADPRCILWRPFLSLSKETFRAYAQTHQLEWREDASNSDVRHQRNRLRHELFPFIRKAFGNQGLEGPLRSCELIQTEHALIAKLANKWEADGDEAASFSSQHRGLQRELIRRALIGLGQSPTYDKIERLVDAAQDQDVMLAPGLKVRRLERMPLLKAVPESAEEVSFSTVRQELLLERDSGQVPFDGCHILWKRCSMREWAGMPSPSHFAERFDADALGARICLRHWHPGDRMALIGGHGSTKLQDLFTNLKWSSIQRHQAVVATDALGRIFWVEGLRIAEFAKVTPATQCIIQWRWERKTSLG